MSWATRSESVNSERYDHNCDSRNYCHDSRDGAYSIDKDTENYLPDPPTFTDELIEQCKRDLDFRPILFEWYKFIGAYCNVTACLTADSPAFRNIPPVHFAVLIGLLNRCSRLMLANIRLSCTGRYGETTQLLDRSIEETAIKIQWLCHKDDTDCFRRYLADGLKNDLKLKRLVEDSIRNRRGNALAIETQMLRSIQEHISLSGLSEQEVDDTKNLPDFAAMCQDLDLGVLYMPIQGIGSHAVHGTWIDLLSNYLTHDTGQGFRPRDHEIDTQDVQYMIVSQLVLMAVSSFVKYLVADPSNMEGFLLIQKGIERKFVEMQDLAWALDFKVE